jgi:ATP dependent DNA ligase domain
MRESRPLASRERQPCRELESPFRWVESRATRLHQSTMSLRPGTLAAGFVWPCLPTKTHEPPSGGLWIHEIKHDGFRIIARKNGARVRLYSRPGNDLTRRFPLIVETLARLRLRSHPSWPRRVPASGSTSILKATARPSSPMPARWGSKASCPSSGTRPTVPARAERAIAKTIYLLRPRRAPKRCSVGGRLSGIPQWNLVACHAVSRRLERLCPTEG